MKFLALILLPFFADSALALEPSFPLPGSASYQGSFSVTQKRSTEMVNANTEAGRTRLEKLRSEKRECTHLQNLNFRCVGFETAPGLEPEVAGKVNQLLTGAVLVIGEKKGEPSQSIDAPTYQEWFVPQPIEFLGKKYDHYRYAISGNEVHKMFFGNPAETGVVLRENGRIGFVLSFTRQLSRDVLATYIVEADFER